MNKTSVFLSLGSNLGDKQKNLHNARAKLSEFCAMKKKSSLYLTEPWCKRENSRFLNQVLLCETDLGAFLFLKKIMFVEKQLGRIRTAKSTDRKIDIDILLFGKNVINTPTLQVPHPYLTDRDFFLLPLLEISPGNILHPKEGRPLSDFSSFDNETIIRTLTTEE